MAVPRPYVNILLYFQPIPTGPRRSSAAPLSVEKMMLEERLEQDMRAALKAGEQAKLSTLRMMRSEILREKKKGAAGQGLTDDEVTTVIQAYGKKLRESAAEYEKLGRPEEAGKIREELSVVQSYLPQPLTEAEVRDLVKQVLAELQLTSVKEFGRAMKEIQARAKGRADGKLLSEIVRSSLD